MKDFLFFLGVCVGMIAGVIVLVGGVSIALRATGSGNLSGRLTDVTWEGRYFESCEIGVQYGEQSSRVEFLSSRNKALCDELVRHLGKAITFAYDIERYSLTTEQRKQVTDYQLAK